MEKKGFNLLELMIVVIIIGVLAGIAVPNYLRIKEKTHGAEARNTLAIIYRGYKTLRAELGNLNADLTPSQTNPDDWNVIMMDNPNESARAWFAYSVYDNNAANNSDGTAEVNSAVARRRNLPLGSYSVNFDSAKYLRIYLNTGDITSSPEY